MTKNPKIQKTVLASRPPNPSNDLNLENTPEIMIPKMAIVGFFDTVEQFAKLGKQIVCSSTKGLNPVQMTAVLGALQNALDMISQAFVAYEISLKRAKTKNKTTKKEKLHSTPNPEKNQNPSEKEGTENDGFFHQKVKKTPVDFN